MKRNSYNDISALDEFNMPKDDKKENIFSSPSSYNSLTLPSEDDEEEDNYDIPSPMPRVLGGPNKTYLEEQKKLAESNLHSPIRFIMNPIERKQLKSPIYFY